MKLNFFEGTIPEAIFESKTKNTIFVVVILSKNETTNDELLEALEKISPQLSEFVLVRLLQGSENEKHFFSLYPNLEIPVVVFIDSRNGFILSSCTEASKLLTQTQEAFFSFQKSSPEILMSDSSRILTTEEKIKRAKNLLKSNKRTESRRNDLQTEKEFEKRNTGKDFKEKQKALLEKESLKEHQEIVKETKKALETVRAQIAQDRLNKAQKSVVFSNPEIETKKKYEEYETKKGNEKNETSYSLSSTTKILFRRQNGESAVQIFDSKDPLSVLYAFVSSEMKGSDFSLYTSYPRQFLENSLTSLSESHLVPSSTILIVPNSKALLPSVSHFLAFLLTPFTVFWNFLSRFLLPGPSSTSEPRKKKQIKRDGNISRLNNDDDDDDDNDDDSNNTWNGNSTQQM